jgi:two-component system, response regulator RegA
MIENCTTFLIIDDEENFTLTLKKLLQRRGFTAHIAHDLQTACEENRRYQPHYIVLDLSLTHENGLSILEQLKTENPQTKILVLTGYASIATAVHAIKLGATHYLAKPVDIDELLSAFTLEASPPPESSFTTPANTLDQTEWEKIQTTLVKNNFNVSKTAQVLGLHRRTLQRKLKKRPQRTLPIK